ncbi:MAG TPA: glycosyltransferase [Actinomycetota bacterium]|nr:glycosyltransferase [Actinomycetota bacterium]
MARIHLVYPVPPPAAGQTGPLAGLRYRAGAALDRRRPSRYREGREFSRALPAPTSITANLFKHLSERHRTLLYDWSEHGAIDIADSDILIGHPHPTHGKVFSTTMARMTRGRVVMMPLHHAMPQISAFAIEQLQSADLILGLMGEHWYDTIDGTFLAPFKEKIVRLDMAIDATSYPFLRERFNPPGRRGILWVGANRPEKGVDLLSRIAARSPGVPRGWIGPGASIPHIHHIAAHARLTPSYVRHLMERYDIFVNTSISDANPTTVLEAMAWGFPLACTPGSGYQGVGSIETLDPNDIEACVATVARLQQADEGALQEAVAVNRRLVQEFYTWERFCLTVDGGLAQL